MGVCLETYRAAIGCFNFLTRTSHLCPSATFSRVFPNLFCCICLFIYVFFSNILILLSGDIEINPGPCRNLTLNIGHINARSLGDEISSLVLNEKFDIFAVSETWLNSGITSNQLHIPGFSQLFRLDRHDGRRAGGVALYTLCSIVAKRMLHLENFAFEVLWVEMTINHPITVCRVCYRPPNSNYYAKIFHDESLSSNFGISLYRWLECNNLSQVINEPTRVTANGGTVLDLIITNTPGYFVVSGTVSPPSMCDHSVIYASMNISLVKPKCYRCTIWDMSNIHIHKMSDAFAVLNCDNFLITDDVQINSVYDQWF